MKEETTPFILGVLAIVVAIFLLWRAYSKNNDLGPKWMSNKNIIIPIAMFLILRGGLNLVKIFLDNE